MKKHFHRRQISNYIQTTVAVIRSVQQRKDTLSHDPSRRYGCGRLCITYNIVKEVLLRGRGRGIGQCVAAN